MTRARPTAASAAAMAIEKMATITPVGFCGSGPKRQKATKFRFAAANIISMPIKMKMACRRLRAASKPMENKAAEMMRTSCRVTLINSRPERGNASPLFLHHENESADQRRGEEEADALERPDVIGHEHLPDALHR